MQSSRRIFQQITPTNWGWPPFHPSIAEELTYSEEQMESALKRVGPRSYVLENLPDDHVQFCVLGCQGEKHEEHVLSPQEENAIFLNKLIQADPTLKPHFIILLGDNFYPAGMQKPVDKRYKNQFYTPYHSTRTAHLRVPFFICSGNHDYNFQKWGKVRFGESGWKLVRNQIFHTYIPKVEGESVEDNVEMYSQDRLDYTKLQPWNMPFYYYSIIIPPTKTPEKAKDVGQSSNATVPKGGIEIFIADSNTIVKDYLLYKKFLETLDNINDDSENSEKEDDSNTAEKRLEQFAKNNQIAWLLLAYRRAIKAGRTPLIAMHHPIITCGKRAYHGDAAHYLSSEELIEANALFGFEKSSTQYNPLIEKIFASEGLKLTSIGAHDHYLHYLKTKKNTQIVSGGGGSLPRKLQQLEYFEKWRKTGTYIRKNGAVFLNIDRNNPETFDIKYRAPNVELNFTNQSSEPVRNAELIDLDPNVTAIRRLLFSCFERYQTFLVQQCRLHPGNFFKNLVGFSFCITHSHENVNLMHDMINYLNKPYDDNLANTLKTIYDLMEKLPNKTSDHSLYCDINKTFKNSIEFKDNTFEQLYYAHKDLPPKLG